MKGPSKINRFALAAAVVFSASALFASDVEKEHLKLYASFDKGTVPEIAKDGFRLKDAAPLPSADGRYGGAVSIGKNDPPADLQYVTDKADFGASGWTLAMWVRMNEDAEYRYADKTQIRGIFSTNGATYERGSTYSYLSCWVELLAYRHPALSGRMAISSRALDAKEWVHLAYVFAPDGSSEIYVNGNVASYQERCVGKWIAPVCSLRIGGVLGLDGSRSVRLNDFDLLSDRLDGCVDELKVLDKALAPGEVREVMTSLPLRRTADIALYMPCDGDASGRGADSFSAVDLVFADGYSREGVKIVRHGYDRRAVLNVSGVPVGAPAASVFAYFRPDWTENEPPDARHGLWHAASGGFSHALEKNTQGLVYTVSSGGKSASATLRGVPWRKDAFSKTAAGYDFSKRRMYVSVDGLRSEAEMNLPPPAAAAPGVFDIGDVAGADTYSRTQAEGILDEILAANEYLTGDELAEVVETEIAKKPKSIVATVVNAPVSAREATLWDLAGAEREKTAVRERITLNALWRFQLTDAKRAFDEKGWLYLPIPGRYSGQENGGADSEFYFRDADMNMLPRTVFDGRDSFRFVNGWFERAFKADPSWKNRRIILRIEELSNSQSGTVFLNGRTLASVPAGAQFLEIAVPEHRLDFGGWNYLTINAVDSGQRWNWRGIKGDVSLEICDRVRIEHPEIVTSVKNGRIAATVEISNDSSKEESLSVEMAIAGPGAPPPVKLGAAKIGAGGRAVLGGSAEWKNARLWDVDSPDLYTCRFRVRDAAGRLRDETPPVSFGFREFEIRGRDFFLNGKKIHLFICEQWKNRLDPENARATAALFKGLGFNAVRMDFEGSNVREEPLFRACDEAGLLYLPNVLGVCGREFATWSDAKVRKDLEDRMRARIRAWRNHASAAMWYMSVNYLGYAWDYHPLKIADGYTSPFQEGKYKTCLEGVKILRKYDKSGRPYFFQAGGAFGEVHTSNAYFCWWPQAEREEWPRVWYEKGKKPLVPIETGFPYFRSFFGMDLHHPGNRPLFYFENLARFYGPSIYESDDPDMTVQTRQTIAGKEAVVWCDAPGVQRLKCDLLPDSIRVWRGFDVSGICPFGEIEYACGPHAKHHSRFDPKTDRMPPRDFRRFGWTPDAVKHPYQRDVNPALPLPAGEALKKALAPKIAFFDGGAAEPADRRRNYRCGERIDKRLVLVNDSRKKATFSGKWRLGETAGDFEKTLEPGATGHVGISATLPGKKCSMRLTAEVNAPESITVDPLRITVQPAPSAHGIGSFALYDTVGKTADKMDSLGVAYRKTDDLSGVRDGLLVVGTECLDGEFSRRAAAAGLADSVNSGALRVVFMAQKPESLARLGIRTVPVYARTAFDARGRSFGPWAGRGTFAPEFEPPDPQFEVHMPVQFFHWSNLNMLSSYPVLRPSDVPYKAILVCGKDLVYSPLIEVASGRGAIVFCQLEIESRTVPDVESEALMLGMLRKYSHPDEAIAFADKTACAEDAAALGVRVAETNISGFAVAPAGMRIFNSLSARDRFFRYPVRVQTFSGEGVEPLTEPAFVAVKTIDGKRVLLTGMPQDACADYLAAGVKDGMDSSTLWAAETLDNRLKQIRSLADRAAGVAAPGTLAERLCRPLEETADAVFPYSGWKSTYHTEKHIRW